MSPITAQETIRYKRHAISWELGTVWTESQYLIINVVFVARLGA